VKRNIAQILIGCGGAQGDRALFANASLRQLGANASLNCIAIELPNSPGGNILLSLLDHGAKLSQAILPALERFQRVAQHCFRAGERTGRQLRIDALLDINW
jgi:hypothetical protein